MLSFFMFTLFLLYLVKNYNNKNNESINQSCCRDDNLLRLSRCAPVTGEFPAQMASNAEMFPFDDVIMLM